MVDKDYTGKVAKSICPPKPKLSIINLTPTTVPNKRRHVRAQPPTHSGPPSQSLVITTGIPPIIIDYAGTKRSYTRHQIARDLHMHPSTVSMLFSGKRNLTMGMALRFKSYFGCSLDYLIDVVMPASKYLVREVTNEQRAKYLNEQANPQANPQVNP